MTFEEFKKMAVLKSQEEDCCVYFLREYFIEDFSELFKNGVVKCLQPKIGFVRNLAVAKRMIRKTYEDFSADEYKPYRAFFTIDACKYGKFARFEYDRFNRMILQSWSSNYKAQIIEHGIIRARFYGKSKRNKHFQKGTQVGVLFPNNMTVELGIITQTPPSVKDVWEFREGVRQHYKDIGLSFSESEWQYDEKCPKDFYRVKVADKEFNVRPSLLIPLPDHEKL